MAIRQLPFTLVLLSYSVQSIDHRMYFDKTKPDLETHLTWEDFDRAKYSRVHRSVQLDDSSMDSVLYRPDRLEGDIVPPGDTLNHHRSGVFRSAVRNRMQTWPSRRIPYAISSQYSSFSRSRIAAALEEYAKKTCVEFVARTEERDYVYIAPDDGCYSTIGRAGGRQMVSIGAGCVNFGIIVHELMHAVGFFHEQSRPDRDEFVVVNWTNVADDMKDQFTKYGYGMINTMGFDYDYGSIMHYSNRAFTKNGLPTLVPRMDGVRIGQRDGFSHLDMTKINALYSCDQTDQTLTMERRTAHTGLPQPPPSEPCNDQMDDCAFRKGLGYCHSIRHWMRRFCKRTCRACPQDESDGTSRETTCLDSSPHCKSWSRAGFCAGHTDVREKCRRTCGLC